MYSLNQENESMPHRLLDQLFDRVSIDKQESDFAYFWALCWQEKL